MKKNKPKDNLRVPVKDSTLIKPPTDVPPVVPVGHLVQFTDRTGEHDYLTGWVVQNPMSPGGQTNSYLIIPIFYPGLENTGDQEGFVPDPQGIMNMYANPFRISQSEIVASHSILDLELDI